MNDTEILAKLYREIYGTDKGKEIKSLFEADIKKVRSLNNVITVYKKYEIYLIYGRNFGTMKNLFGDFRKIINKIDNKHKELLLDVFSLPKGFHYLVSEKYSKVIEDRKESDDKVISLNEYKNLIDETYKNGMDKTLSFWKKGIGSRQTKEGIRAYFLASYLALTTGRRLTEILKTMVLTKYKNNIKVKGLLKYDEDKSFDLFVLDEPNNVMSAYHELRKILNTVNLTNKECNSKFNSIFNKFLKENILEGVTFHDLRSMYAEIAWELFDKSELSEDDNIEQIKDEFMNNVLLHAEMKKQVRSIDFYKNRFKIEKR